MLLVSNFSTHYLRKLLLLVFLFVSLCAAGQSFSFSFQRTPLSTVFSQIEQRSDYQFIYTEELLARSVPVSFTVSNVSIDSVLKLCFKQQPLDYTMEGKHIVIRKKIVEKPASQFRELRGKVVNEQGEPVPGITLAIKYTSLMTASDGNGEFIFFNAPMNVILLVSGVGTVSEELAVGNQPYILVTVHAKVAILEETIIRGYYNSSRRLNTGSIDKVTAADIGVQPVSNPIAALEGRVPGLLISQGNGLPGSNFTVRIRGQNSIQSGNSPLYIIDGAPFLNDADVLTQRSGINAASPFNTLNPEDIESIEILKDADATAIYGSRGANGVVLITTKKGKAGKTKVDVNFYSGWGKVTRTMQYMNTPQFLAMRHEAFKNDGQIPDLSSAYDFLVWDTTRYTDLKKILIGGVAHTDKMQFQISGGSVRTNFSASGNYYRESTVFPGNGADRRGSVHFAISHRSDNNKLSISLVSSYATDINDLIREDLTQFVNLSPTIPNLYDSLGHLNWGNGGFSFVNPLSDVYRKYKVITDRLTSNVVLDYEIFRQVKLKLNLGYNQLFANETDKVPIASQDPSFLPTGYSFFGTNQIKSWIAEPQLNYDFKIGKKAIFQSLVGVTWQANSGYQTSISGTGYTNDNLLGSTVGAHDLETRNSSQIYRYNAVFGRLNFNWDEKYLINLTARRDGSSRFGPGNRFTNFGASGLAWIFSKEKFIASALPGLSFGKLRLSYGITGNDLIGNYNYLDAYSPTQYPYQGVSSLFPAKLFNANYGWEQIQKTDVGMDLAFLGNKLSFTVDWFGNKSKNQIIYYLLPGQTGFPSVLQNFPGVVKNEGIELQVALNNISLGNFNWSSSFNFSLSKNRLSSFPGLATSSYSTRYVIGKPLNAYIGPEYAGVDTATGVYQFYDINRKLTFSPSQADYVYIGTTDPKFYGGFQNNITYKNWNLLFLFEYRQQKGIDPITSSYDFAGDMNNQPVNVLDRWQKPGDKAMYERYTQTFSPAGIAVFRLGQSSAILTDASFIRLKNLSISYSLPSAVLNKKGIEKIRLFLEGQNVLTITKYKGFDPETQSTRSLPPLRMLVTGVQIVF